MGNDFILIEAEKLSSETVRKLCHRRLGIGADGVILYMPSTRADVAMRIFNADGSEAAMCGNGLRVLAEYLGQNETSVDTLSGIRHAKRDRNGIAVDFGKPTIKHVAEGALVDTGVPHLILDSIELYQRALELRRKYNANVNFVEKRGNDLFVRTFERGVEAETGACGTGGAAAAAVYFAQNILYPSGERATVTFEFQKKNIMNVFLTGSVSRVFEGNFLEKSLIFC